MCVGVCVMCVHPSVPSPSPSGPPMPPEVPSENCHCSQLQRCNCVNVSKLKVRTTCHGKQMDARTHTNAHAHIHTDTYARVCVCVNHFLSSRIHDATRDATTPSPPGPETCIAPLRRSSHSQTTSCDASSWKKIAPWSSR